MQFLYKKDLGIFTKNLTFPQLILNIIKNFDYYKIGFPKFNYAELILKLYVNKLKMFLSPNFTQINSTFVNVPISEWKHFNYIPVLINFLFITFAGGEQYLFNNSDKNIPNEFSQTETIQQIEFQNWGQSFFLLPYFIKRLSMIINISVPYLDKLYNKFIASPLRNEKIDEFKEKPTSYSVFFFKKPSDFYGDFFLRIYCLMNNSQFYFEKLCSETFDKEKKCSLYDTLLEIEVDGRKTKNEKFTKSQLTQADLFIIMNKAFRSKLMQIVLEMKAQFNVDFYLQCKYFFGKKITIEDSFLLFSLGLFGTSQINYDFKKNNILKPNISNNLKTKEEKKKKK